MRKLIIAITLIAATGLAQAANTMCDMKHSNYERSQCYELMINGGLVRMKENYRRIKSTLSIPVNERNYIDPAHAKWANEVDHKCRDARCTYDNIFQRNQEIEDYMRTRGLKPM